jgi:hypothetical protein
MKTLASARQLSSLLLTTLLLATPAIAQQKQPITTPSPKESAVRAQPTGTKEDEITFDTLLAARSYKLYGEVRMIGQLARSNAVTELIEPARLLGAPPKEVTSVIEFLNANADALATSRLMFAATPARAGLPQNFVAVELASPADAIKLEPKFRSFFSSLKTETPAPARSGTPKTEAKKTGAAPKPQTAPAPANAAKPVHVQRAGSLILMSDASFALKNLRPYGSQFLSSDQNFQRVRSRFASEPLFIYYDVNLAPHTSTDVRLVAGQHTLDVDPLLTKPPVQTGTTVRPPQPSLPVATPSPVAPENPSPDTIVTIEEDSVPPEGVQSPVEPATGAGAPGSKRSTDQMAMALPMFGALFGGAPNLPEAVGVAVALEGDDVVVRAMLINAPGTPNNLIPFIPALVSGPEIAPRAAALSPAETAMFVSASLDWPRIYDAMMKGMKSPRRPDDKGTRETDDSSAFELQIAMLEQALGFKIKEDLLGSLGNEVAVNLPASLFKFSPNTGIQIASEATTNASQSSQPGITVFISLNDKERVREMLPRVLEVLGLKAAGAAAQTEKRAGIEITNYGTVSMAFIDDFLVISPEVAALRSLIDAHENNQTLAGNADFKNSMSWQSSRVLGQVYMSSDITAREETFVQLDDKLQQLFARFSQKLDPITHAVFNDSAGLFHELHLPREWVAMMLAGLTIDRATTPIMDNELRAVTALMSIRAAETSYKAGKGKGSFATRDQLVSERLVPRALLEREGYRIEITITGDRFEVTATPTEYGKTGRQSFYMDESGVIRGADHGGQPATVADKPL